MNNSESACKQEEISKKLKWKNQLNDLSYGGTSEPTIATI
jgi:hypothetical protein